MQKNKKRGPVTMGIYCTLIVFLCLVTSFILTFAFTLIANFFHWNFSANLLLYALIILGVSAAITIISFRIFSSRLMSSEQAIKRLLREIAHGNFDVQLPHTNIRYLDDSITDINTVLAELKSVKIMRNNFISDFSHELKTPMVTISGFAELLLGDCTDEERKEYADIIFEESKRLTKLSGNILLLNKINGKTVEQDMTTFDLNEEVSRCVCEQSRKAIEKNVELHYDGNGKSIPFFGDKDLLKQVWINLLNNSVKYTPSGGHVNIFVAEAEREIQVRVSDDGIGMDEETVKHAFDQFFQADASHASEGNGLGLSIAHRIVQLYNGKIEITSAPGQGSTFTVTLPVSK